MLKRFIPLIFVLIIFPLLSFRDNGKKNQFPYAQAGLTPRQAAAHLLSRFTYGPTSAQVDAVVSMGLENWFGQQLAAEKDDPSLKKSLEKYAALTLSNSEVATRYIRNGQILRMAIRDGAIGKDSLSKDQKDYRQKLQRYALDKGIQPQQELIRQFTNQKIIRAVSAQNQLQEVMAEFWFNHFNVSFTKGSCIPFIPSYERDVIRPNALGNFETLLIATAKSPAMLMYLDNFSSVGTNSRFAASNTRKGSLNKSAKPKKAKGLNENYAREVMELHTLGVDGGYTQKDVGEAARVFTGWTVYPMGNEDNAKNLQKIMGRTLKARGFIHEGDFLFTPNRHDDGEKAVLGRHFPAGGGYKEGLQLLQLLARHPATASFICRKIAVRFVNDDPPSELIERMKKTFLDTKGDIRQVLVTLVMAPEFWTTQSLREKTKSPFELAVSAVRCLNAEITQPQPLLQWITRMGEKVYYYQAPTGFPDKGQYWINTGSLLSRMNFGLALATGKIQGIKFNILELNKSHEPESASAALQTYCALLLPEREIAKTIERLNPLLNHPDLEDKIGKATDEKKSPENRKKEIKGMDENDPEDIELNKIHEPEVDMKNNVMPRNEGDYSLAQVVGIILGSPEFQRR